MGAHFGYRFKGSEVKAGAKGIGPPEFDVIGVVMGLFDYSFPAGIPLADAEIHALPDLRVDVGEPFVIAADPPGAVDFHDSSELAVGGGVEIMSGRADGQVGAEVLVPFVALVN